MKGKLFLTCLVVLWSVFRMEAQENRQPVSVIPYPVTLTEGEGSFTFSKNTVIALENKELVNIAKDFITLFTRSAGFTPHVKMNSKKGDVCLLKDETLGEESYVLDIKPEKILIKSSGMKGAFYALQTLRQLLPPCIEGASVTEGMEWTVPVVSVTDEPRFAYRGLMVDVARYFLPKEHLLRVIDNMGMLKLNKLHLHLTDDTGWRLEIKRYPLLTQIGSKRVERPGKLFPERRNARQGEPMKDGGFYTQDDIREIVAYASDRQVEVIPEIAMPGHSNAALAAYPLLACPVTDKYIGVVPGLGGEHTGIVFCAGNEDTFTFLQNVIDEVAELFPSPYIHLGGDTVRRPHWVDCPLCKERMQKEGLKSGKDLLGYFMRRIDTYVRGKGKTVMGWEEVMDANLSKGAVVFDWRGYGHGAVKASKSGHHFVVTPTGTMYLNRYQGPQWQEPVLAFEGGNSLKNIYQYEPVERYWTMSMRSLLLGMQASLWTEFCDKAEDVDYLLYPRLAAVAEAAWSSPMVKKWERFVGTLDGYMGRWEAKGIKPSRAMFNIRHEVVPKFGSLEVSLDCIRPDVDIRYTVDGSEPDSYSTLYRRPWQVKDTVQTVKCATFKGEKQVGKTLVLPIRMNPITGKNILRSNAVERRIVNGVRGSLKHTDGEWASWTHNDSIALTLDAGSRKRLSRVSLGCLNDFGMAIHKPKAIEVWLSDNEVTYRKSAEKRFTSDEIFREGRFVEDLELELDDAARYVRIILYGAGKCPSQHVRPQENAQVFIDEVLVE